ncbi:RNMT-activating mRNA cap methyltransferase subunit [Pseudonaja textilis]|uniref:RNA guanine-7 methyltransferase activating subunit n=1 Tax=Pseudonaja textilis TaxID=8673 RepID=A0A670Y9W5_PSETE|nr:RNMT-activating mRNA cap methyltransferase subunit [Pseudonaja textilis]XP_026565613.1 RNMT-activating mRNA cap methyltransferase subunit [Pseudonaja textilis]XP_026565614.1 RNMT-activating mRNA cap methyltransferase subunit [Pseudonaja textilis]
MASTNDVVQNYQSMFAYRYTTEDKEYQKYLQSSANPPPIIEDWMNREPSAPSVSEILQNYENKFAHRFTSEDEEYQKYVQRPADPPPLLEDWRNRSGGNQRYRDRFRDSRQFRNRGPRYDHPGGYRSEQWHEKGYGTRYQPHQYGQSSYPQHGWPQRGYGSYFQEPRYGRY